MKQYDYNFYSSLTDALRACEAHQHWNVVNIYPTGRDHEVTLVYYIE